MFILQPTKFEIISGNEVNQDEEEIDDDEEGAEAAEAEKTKDDSSTEVEQKKTETEDTTTTTTPQPVKVPEEKPVSELVNASPLTTSVDDIGRSGIATDGWSGLTVKPKADTVKVATVEEDDEKMEVVETQEVAPPPKEPQQEKPKVSEKEVESLVEKELPTDANAPKEPKDVLPPREEVKEDKKTSTATTAIGM